MYRLAWCLAVGALALGLQEPSFSPARFRDGHLPAIPIAAVGAGEVIVELDVSDEGDVTRTGPLRVTPPFTDMVTEALRDWHFLPARDAVDQDAARAGRPTSRKAVPSNVLVAAVFRAPVLVGPTLGEMPKDVASASDAVPFPLTTTQPAYPPHALFPGVVLLEVKIDETGKVGEIGVLSSAPPFDDAAREALAAWRFRPARVNGVPAAAVAYVIFAFRVPITSPSGPTLLRRAVVTPD